MTFITEDNELHKIDESENSQVANQKGVKPGIANRFSVEGRARGDDVLVDGDLRTS